MIRIFAFLSLLLAILATAQNADTSQISDTAASIGVVPPSSTNSQTPGTETTLDQSTPNATLPLITTVTSDGLPIIQTTGFTTIYPSNFTSTSTTVIEPANSTALSITLSSQRSTTTDSTASSSLLSSSSDSTGLPVTPGDPASSFGSNSPDTSSVASSSSHAPLSTGTDGLPITLTSSTFPPPTGTDGSPSASSSSLDTNTPITSSSIASGETSSLATGSLTNTSSVLSPNISTSVPPGESPSASLGISTSVSDTSVTVVPPGQPITTPPPATTTTSYSDEEIDSYLSMTTWDNFGVSSTITTDPTISASQTLNSKWKKNFWLHTNIDGKPTDLPVVHCGCVCKGNCDNDDDDDDVAALWVVYFHVPKVPNVQISLPKLPDFHLGGCIKVKVPVINIDIPLGKCPPVSDNGAHDHSDPDDPKNKNKEPDPNDPSDPNEESPTSTSSSSSSCSGAVVTDFLTHISCVTSGATGTQCATTVETGTRSGCSLTGTASVTTSASDAACARQSWPTSYGPGVGYSQPGFKYGTYTPPEILQSLTMSFSSMTVSGSGGIIGPTTGPSLTTLSTVVSSSVSPSDGSGSATPTPTSSTISDSSSVASSSASDSGTPSGSPTDTTSVSPTTTGPAPFETLHCQDNTEKYWVSQETMQKGISDFCEEVSKATDWDDRAARLNDHKLIERMYNKDSNDEVMLFVSSTTEALDNAFQPINKDDCNSNMTKIFNDCPPAQDIPGIDWRHGGQYMNGDFFWVILAWRPKYRPGTCTFLVAENMWSAPNTDQEHHWATKTSITDAQGNVITPMSNDWDELYFGNQGYNKVPGLYSDLQIDAGFNSSGGETFYFTVGNYQFSPKYPQDQDGDEVPRCQVGNWDEPGGNHYRNTSCWVYC